MSSKDTDEERLIYSKSDNIEIMTNDKADEVIKGLYESLLSEYQIGLEESMRGCDFFFDYVHLLHFKCHKINLNRSQSYRGFPGWIKSKKATINPISENDDK